MSSTSAAAVVVVILCSLIVGPGGIVDSFVLREPLAGLDLDDDVLTDDEDVLQPQLQQQRGDVDDDDQDMGEFDQDRVFPYNYDQFEDQFPG